MAKSLKTSKIRESNKHVKQTTKKSAKVQNDITIEPRGKGGGRREVRKSSKIIKKSEIRQNGSPGRPGLEKASQRHSKGIQKDPKWVQKASKGVLKAFEFDKQ